MNDDFLDVYRSGEYITVDTGVDCFDLTKDEVMSFIAALSDAASQDPIYNNEELN